MTRRLTVAIPSYRRPETLARALAGVNLAIQRLPATESCEILVIDNDPDRSARPVVDAVARARYVSEPTPGLAAVRNRALDEASDSDLLVFLDDDEEPEPEWLLRMLEVLDDTGCDAVAGKVVTPLPENIDPWLTAVGAFVRPRRVDRQLMPEAATNNLLLELSSVRASGVRFDPRFGLTGGEDSLFTRQFTASGRVIRWAESAVVRENVIASRIDRRWILMRAYRTGNSSARVDQALADGPTARLAARARDLVGGLARIGVGSASWLVGATTRSLPRRARGLRAIYRGAGYVSGAAGAAFEEYRRT
jgi:glycosyltransferase involved in cell wall biosynthesis